MCSIHMPLTAGTKFGVCNIISFWTVKCFFSQFLLDGIPANVVGILSRRWRSMVSVHGEGMKRL